MIAPALSRRLRLTVLCTSLGASLLAASHSADAVGTRRFELDDQEDFLSGELRGVSVDSQGHVRAGWNLGTVTLAGVNTVWSSLVLADGSVLLGTGNNGKVMKIAGGQATEFADTKQLAVTSLIHGPGSTVFAATIPSGKIFKLDGPGAMTELPAIADVESVWQLAWDPKKNGFYAATGPNGKLFFVQPAGQAQVVFDSDETHLLSVAVTDDGTVYTGSNGKGLLYKVTGPGRATVVMTPSGDEVKAIVPRGNSLYVVSNEIGEGETGGSSRGGGLRPPSGGRGAGGGGRAGRGHLYRVEADGRSEELLSRRDTHFVSLALDDAGRPFVGSGVEGRVFTVDDNHTSTVMADTESRQVGALVVSGKTKFVVGSDPAAFHEIRGVGGADATWSSKVLDAGLRATYGRVFWRSDGAVEMATRTGNSLSPDSTWSDWSQPLTAPGKPSSPPGRFIQLRARFGKDANAVLREVSVPFVTDNLRAVVTSIEAKSKSSGTSSGATVPSSGSEIPSRTSSVKISWKVDNPDSDQLRYRVQFRFDSQNVWRDLTKPDDVFIKSEIDWETATLPEGTYRIRVEATDETANPPDRVTRHSLESGPVLVDNTAPVFRKLTAAGRRLQGEAVDGLGPIVRIDFSIDGRSEWRPLLAKDGVFDEPAEEFDADLSSVVGAGNHLIAVRAYDQAGNFVIRDVEMK